MRFNSLAILAASAGLLAACGSGSGLNPFGGSKTRSATIQATRAQGAEQVAVNRYLWAASLDLLSFLPVQSVDPFTGVIITGFGTPPGGSTAYRATVHVRDPALAARSLNVALFTRSGTASAGTNHAVEDAILTRARQLRVQDGKL